jgi:hypothetical protein
MTSIARLVTWVDGYEDGRAKPPGLTFKARLDAVLDDGRRVVLDDSRGWTRWILNAEANKLSEDSTDWSRVTREGVEEDARSAVGPDYPEDTTDEQHLAMLEGILRRKGINVEPGDPSKIPHDVEFSDGLRARLGGS